MINYHGHTYRCGHAAMNPDEDYVIEALKANYSEIGISDHVMLPFIRKTNQIRGEYSQKDEYLKSIRSLQEKYKKLIKIYVGFECEWDDSFECYYRSLLENKEVDYLIFGNHNMTIKDGEFTFMFTNPKSYLEKYGQYTMKALNSHLFKIMAHPDLFMCYVGWSEECEKLSKIICECALKNNVALELNAGCLINDAKKELFGEVRYRYPYKRFWEIVKEYGNTVVIGMDVHFPKAYATDAHQQLEEFAKEIGITITDKLAIENVLEKEMKN